MKGSSWSWASLDFDYADIEFIPPGSIEETLVSIVEARVESTSGDIFGHLCGGYVKLEGRIDQIFSANFPNPGPWLSNHPSYQFNLDVEGNNTNECLYCLPIVIYNQGRSPGHNYPSLITCLLLRPENLEVQAFVRAGTMEVSLDTEVILPRELHWIVDFSRAARASRFGLSTITIY